MAESTVRLRFEDGHEESFAATDDEDILGQALRRGLRVIHQCRSGSCGTCVAKLVQGQAQVQRWGPLLCEERDRGHRLLCSTRALADVTFELPYPYTLTEQEVQAQANAVVDEVEFVAADVVRLKLTAEQPLHFRSGQYARLNVPGTGDWRSYSFASSPGEREAIFYIRLYSGGAMSGYLRERARPGHRINLEAPFGKFTLHEDDARGSRPIVFVAGGTGLAPTLSMLDSLRRGGSRAPMVVCFACRTQASLFGLEELELREFWMPELTVRIGVSREEPLAPRLKRANPVQLLEEFAEIGPATAYVCGSPELTATAVRKLEQLGLARIVTEQFVASDL